MKTTRPLRSPRLHWPRSGSARRTLIALKRSVARQLTRKYTRHLPPALVRRAVADAEELARETGYPHLFFPALAEEKVRIVFNFLATEAKLPPLAGRILLLSPATPTLK